MNTCIYRIYVFFIYSYDHHHDLHSFPTRRSSDLPADLKPDVRAALAQRDFVALEALLAGTPLRSAEHELLLRFPRSEEHTSELQSLRHLVCRLLLEKKKKNDIF